VVVQVAAVQIQMVLQQEPVGQEIPHLQAHLRATQVETEITTHSQRAHLVVAAGLVLMVLLHLGRQVEQEAQVLLHQYLVVR
jgi:hypothetical protein